MTRFWETMFGLRKIHRRQMACVWLALGTLVIGCTSGFDDPFASQKVGSVSESRTLNLTEVKSSSMVFLRVGHNSDSLKESNGVLRLIEGQKVAWSKVVVISSNGKIIRKSKSDLLKSHSCVDGLPDVQQMLSSYSGLSAVCDQDMIGALESASSITVQTDDGKEHEFTSWGVSFQNIGLTNAMIYSVIL